MRNQKGSQLVTYKNFRTLGCTYFSQLFGAYSGRRSMVMSPSDVSKSTDMVATFTGSPRSRLPIGYIAVIG